MLHMFYMLHLLYAIVAKPKENRRRTEAGHPAEAAGTARWKLPYSHRD